MSTAPQLLNDEQAALQAITGIFTSRDAANRALQQQLGDAQAQAAALKQQLDSVTADDQSLAAKILAAQTQSARLQQLANPGMALQIHRLPNVIDPNARPIMTWFQPGNTGNTGGGSVKPHGTWNIAYNPDGSTDFDVSPIIAFDNYIWGMNFFKAVRTDIHRYLQVTQFEISDEDLQSAMAVETNWEQSLNSFRFNAGIQALLGTDKDAITGKLVTNQWRYYDIGAGHWLDTGIPFDLTLFGTGKKIELVSEFERSDDPAQGMHNISLTINGIQHTVDKWSKAKATTWGPYLQQGFQMDTKNTVTPYKVKVWNMEAYWM